MKKRLFPIVMLGLLVLSFGSAGQTEEELLSQLLEEERNSIEALALYPEATRLSILEASMYPEALVKMESMQNKTSSAFKKLMENYPRETQEKVWDMTRYQGLVNDLVTGGPKSGEDLDRMLKKYPEEVSARAKEVNYMHFPLLTKVDQMNSDWGNAYRELVKNYPPEAQDAFQALIKLPEVLTILTDNIRMTVLVGDMYRRRPAWLLAQMDSLNLVVTSERAKELEDWKASLDDNPQAKDELLQSAQTFAGEYGYDDLYDDYHDNLYYPEDRGPEEVIVEHHYYHHYPYWYGYPYWYMYPRWRPYPVWWDWGFYWGPGRVIVIVDMPSFYFTNWYFYQPYHHYHYPHFSSFMVNHYYGHRHSGGSVSVTVNNWRRDNREIISDEWLETSRKRPDSFREYGKFEEAREKYNRSHTDKPMDKRGYAEANKRKYPDIAREADRLKTRERSERQKQVFPPSTPDGRDKDRGRIEPGKPDAPPKVKEPSNQPEKQRPLPPTRRKEEGESKQKQTPVDIPKVDKARDYHQNNWEKNKPERKRPETAAPKVNRPKSSSVPETKEKTQPRKKDKG